MISTGLYLTITYSIGFILYLITLFVLKIKYGNISESQGIVIGMLFIASPISLYFLVFMGITYIMVEIIPNLINKL